MSKKDTQNQRLFSSVDVTYYNGVAQLLGTLDVPKEGRKVTLRLKRTDAPLALATLATYGNVSTGTVSYSIDEDTSDAIVIDPTDYYGSLFRQLAGSEASITDSDEKVAAEGVIKGVSGIISRSGRDRRVALVGGKQIPFAKIHDVKFSSTSLSDRIERGVELQRQQADPDSVYVTFELTPNDGATTAAIRYVAPAPVWPVTWQLQDDILIGRAAVHSPFGETLENVNLTLTTEQPRFFDTDSFELVVPKREWVKLIDAVAPGAIEAAHEREPKMAGARALRARSAGMEGLGMMDESVALEAASFGVSDSGDSVEVSVSGGYARYSPEAPVTLKSGVGNIIEIYRQNIGESRRVLHYQNPYSNADQRASIATTFQNETGLSLLKGALTVGKSFDGQAILSYTRPDSRAFCVHGVDQLVDIERRNLPTSQYLLGIDLNGGNGKVVQKTIARTTYSLDNTGDDDQVVFVDHTLNLGGQDEIEVTIDGETSDVTEIDHGRRVEVHVPAKSSVSITVVETQVNINEETLRGHREIDRFLTRWVLQTHHPLADDETVTAIRNLNNEISKRQETIDSLEELLAQDHSDVDRLTKSLSAVNAGETGRETYTQQLADANQQIVTRREQGQQVLAEKTGLEEQLHQSLLALALEWQNESGHKLS
jgi:hypothetical protein